MTHRGDAGRAGSSSSSSGSSSLSLSLSSATPTEDETHSRSRSHSRSHSRTLTHGAAHSAAASAAATAPGGAQRLWTCVSLLSLSAELLERVLQHLDVRSLSQVAMACRALQQLRWPVVDLRRFAVAELSADTFRYIVLRRRPHTLLLRGFLGCPRSA